MKLRRHISSTNTICRHVKINGSPVSLTENSAVFRITDFKKSAHSLTVFLLKAISCDNLAEVSEKNQYHCRKQAAR